MMTASSGPASITAARSGDEPSIAGVLVALLGPTLVLGGAAGGDARWGELVVGASCLGAGASPFGLVTRTLVVAAGVVPLGGLPLRSAALSALLVGAMAAASHALLVRALGRLGAAQGLRRELLALGAAWAAAALAVLQAPDALVTAGPALVALCLERALAWWRDGRSSCQLIRRRRTQLALALVLLVSDWATSSLAGTAAALALLLPFLATAAAALGLGLLLRAPSNRALAALPALLAVFLGAGSLALAAERTRAVDGSAPEAVLSALVSELPPRALLVAAADAQHTLCSAQHVQAQRPDVLLVPPPWRLDARAALALERVDPSFRPLLRAQLLDAAPAWPELQALAARRAVLLEPDATLPAAAARTLLPAGLWQQLSTGDVGKTDLRLAAAGADRTLARLATRLDSPRTAAPLRAWLAATARAHATHESTHGEAARAARLEALALAWAPPPRHP